jgi:hypothetical protein
MPLLATLLTTLFGGAAGTFIGNLAKKIGFGIAAATAMSAMTLALFVVMRSALATANGYMSGAPAMFMDALQMVIPPIAPACLSTYTTVWMACTAYAWRRDLAHMMAAS